MCVMCVMCHGQAEKDSRGANGSWPCLSCCFHAKSLAPRFYLRAVFMAEAQTILELSVYKVGRGRHAMAFLCLHTHRYARTPCYSIPLLYEVTDLVDDNSPHYILYVGHIFPRKNYLSCKVRAAFCFGGDGADRERQDTPQIRTPPATCTSFWPHMRWWTTRESSPLKYCFLHHSLPRVALMFVEVSEKLLLLAHKYVFVVEVQSSSVGKIYRHGDEDADDTHTLPCYWTQVFDAHL